MRAPGVGMSIQDGDGFGGIGADDITTTDANLQHLKDRPAVLLLVVQAGRTPAQLINRLKLLKIVWDIGDNSCFLVLTNTFSAQEFGFDVTMPQELDPSDFLVELAKALVGYFQVGRNVVCTDLVLDRNHPENIEMIRAGLGQLQPLKERLTFTEAEETAKGKQNHVHRQLAAIRRDIKTKRSQITGCGAIITRRPLSLAGSEFFASVMHSRAAPILLR
ncbi:hypothetical protein GGF32_004240 [Allomyces javanicus]|nr:hypothetical protein GGF32_004240 [Allomyces javanicus]